MMKNFLQRLSLRIRPFTSGLEGKEAYCTRLLIILIFMAIGTQILYAPFYIILGLAFPVVLIDFIFILAYALTLVLIKKKNISLAKVWLCGIYIFHVALLSILFFSRASGKHFFLLVVLPISYFLYDEAEKMLRFIFIGVSLALFFLNELVEITLVPLPVPAGSSRFFSISAVILVLVALALVLAAYSQELKRAEQAQRELATSDSLTGLCNRRHFYDIAQQQYEICRRYNIPLSLVFIDIDFLKRINDAHGHLAGDEVLQSFGRILKGHFRRSDLVARFGGEEFLCLMPQTPALSARSAAERLRKYTEKLLVSFKNHVLRITMSAGIACLTTEGDTDTLDALIEKADKALYEAKKAGRNRVVIA